MSRLYRFGRYAALSAGALGAATSIRYQKVRDRQEKTWPKHEVQLPPTSDPDIIIIGGGVVGIATAYTCAQKGQKVLIIEPNSGAGKECTACAAGGMQRSNPVVDRNTWLAVLKSSFGQGYQFFHLDWLTTLTDPFFLRWIFTFTVTSLLPGPDQDTKQAEMLKFTDFAVDEMLKFMNRRMARAAGHNHTGSLSVSYDPIPKEQDGATNPGKNPTASKRNHEPNRMLLSTSEVLKVEPSLRFQENPPQSAKFEYMSSAASAERYTEELAKACANNPNVTLLYHTRVLGLTTESLSPKGDDTNRYITTIHTSAGVVNVSPQTQVLVAAGAWLPHLLATCDLYAPVYPLKGYAMSLSASNILKSSFSQLKSSDLPSRVVADAFMYTSRLGDEIRITSIGEFSGWSTQPTPSVDQEFRREAARQFPQLEDFLPTADTRCGLRPYVNDGLVLMGRCSQVPNLLVSCGPGSNGWKMAMGSAAVIQGLAAGKTEEALSRELGFDVSAFAPGNRVVLSPWFTKMCRARWNV